MTLLVRMGLALAVASIAGACAGRADHQPGESEGAEANGGAPAVDPAVSIEWPPKVDPCMGPCPDDISQRPKPLPRPKCPAAEPTLGETCDVDGARCGYGDAAVAMCRDYYDCTDGVWSESRDRPAGECTPRNACPQTPPERLTACDGVDGIPCVYDGLECFCIGRYYLSGGGGDWLCYGPPRDVRCPATLPNLGEGCATRGLQCSYGSMDCRSPSFTSVFCFQGAWEQQTGVYCGL